MSEKAETYSPALFPVCEGPSWKWWAGGLALGLAFVMVSVRYWDGPVAAWVHERGIDLALRKRGSWGRMLSILMKTPGESYFAVVAAVLVLLLDQRRWRAGLFVALAALASGSNSLAKWIAGRQRPLRDDVFHDNPASWQWFRGGLPGLFSGSNLSFPSGHACQAFAVAAAIWMLYPRWGWLALFPAAMVGAERVLSNSHYVSEALAGAVLGIAGTVLARAVVAWLCRRRGVPAAA